MTSNGNIQFLIVGARKIHLDSVVRGIAISNSGVNNLSFESGYLIRNKRAVNRFCCFKIGKHVGRIFFDLHQLFFKICYSLRHCIVFIIDLFILSVIGKDGSFVIENVLVEVITYYVTGNGVDFSFASGGINAVGSIYRAFVNKSSDFCVGGCDIIFLRFQSIFHCFKIIFGRLIYEIT